MDNGLLSTHLVRDQYHRIRLLAYKAAMILLNVIIKNIRQITNGV